MCPVQNVTYVSGRSAALRRGLARLIRSRGERIASHRSVRRCTLSQKSALLPNTRARMRAVGAVILRRALQSPFTFFRFTPLPSASAPSVNPRGEQTNVGVGKGVDERLGFRG